VKVFFQFVLCALAFALVPSLRAQSESLTIERGQKKTLTFSGAFSGFSRDPSIVRVSVTEDTATITGVGVGETEVVILEKGWGKQTILVKCVLKSLETANKQAQKEVTAEEPVKSAPAIGATAKGISSQPNDAGPAPQSKTPKESSSVADSPFSHGGEKSSSGFSTRDGESAQAIGASVVTPPGETVRIRELTQVLVAVHQVSAAYSLDPLIAEAQVTEDALRIWGRAPGHAVVVLVHTDFSTSSIQVSVSQAPPILPEGMWNGLNSNAESKGYYETRVSSNPLEISDVFDYRTSRMQLHFSNATLPSGNLPGVSSTWFPFSYLRIVGDRWKLTLLDENVDSSPISVSATMVRGIHLSAGGITIHAGYTSVAGFQSLFLPAHKQLISGATYTHSLGGDFQMGATGYYIQRDSFAMDSHAAQGVGTIFFRKRSPHGTAFSAEAGLSNGIGGAGSFEHNTDTDQFQVVARYRPRHYAASDIDGLNGLQSEAHWDHTWGTHFISDFYGSATHTFSHPGSQTIEVGAGSLLYKLFKGISFSTGISASNFADQHALFPDIHRIALPFTISYDRPRFGISAKYESSRTTKAFSPGQAFGGSLHWSGGHLQAFANVGLDTQALGIDSVFSAFPNLNVELARLGLGTTTSVEQLAALLNDRAFLNSLGIAPGATLQLVPRNWHGGLNLSWRSGRQALEAETSYNLNQFLTQKNSVFLQTVRYRRGITSSTELVTSFTIFEAASPARKVTPLWEIGLRHQMGDSPFLRLHATTGNISGTVRLQEGPRTTPVRGVEIMLDGDRKTTSDTLGHYQFLKVRRGVHNVEIALNCSRSFYYSSPSKVSTEVDSIVNFGIIYPAAEMVGYALSDAEVGLPEIGILVKGPQGELNLVTDQAGKLFVPVAQPGIYTISVNAETVPDGYALEDLHPVTVVVGEGDLKKFTFKLPAIRALSGSVQVYDPVRGEYVVLAGAIVEIAELNLRTISDANGRYAFRNIPFGIFTMRVNQQQYCKVAIGVGPQLLHQDIKLAPSAVAVAITQH